MTLIFGRAEKKDEMKEGRMFSSNGRVHMKEKIIVHNVSAKIPERKGSISPYSFYGKLTDD